MAALVALWVRLYTRNLPRPVAQRRIDEIDADLHDHIAHERADRTKERQIVLSIAVRMLRGLPADLSWSRTMSKTTSRPAVRIALVTGLILLVPLVGMLVTNDVNWGVFDFVLAGVLLGGAGLLLDALTARKAGNLVYQGFAIAIGVAAIVLGEADDAPGLVGFGCLLIAGTVALAVRTAVRSE
jgi:hypothetical protein